MDEGKTLIVFLCMHRSGSSLTTGVLHRLGMSLGPFDLLGADENNKLGYFEARPFYEVNLAVQQQAMGFPDDVPRSKDVMRHFLETEGRWDPKLVIAPALFDQGRQLVGQLLESGPVCGFKDPRVPLVWPFWSQVLSSFAGLRVIPVLVIRSPHEVAMSMFQRSKGLIPYRDALDVTRVHFQRMLAIRDRWQGDVPLVRFEPEFFEQDLRETARLCGLPWQDDVFAELYDARSRHFDAGLVTHTAQRLYERLSRLGTKRPGRTELAKAEKGAAQREEVLRAHVQRLNQQVASIGQEVEGLRKQRQQAQVEREQFGREREQFARDREQFHQERVQAHQERQQACREREEACREREVAHAQRVQACQDQETLRHQCDAARQECHEARQECNQARQECHEARQECDQARRERDQARQACEQTRQQQAQSQAECAQVRQAHQQVQQQLEATRQAHQQVQQQLEATRQAHQRVQQELEATRQAHQQAQQASAEACRQRDHFQQQWEMARQEGEQFREQCLLSRRQVEQSQKQIEESQRQIEQSREECIQFRQVIEQSQQQCEESRQVCAAYRQEIEALLPREEQLARELAQLKRCRLLKLRDWVLRILRHTPIFRSRPFVVNRTSVSSP